MPVVHPKLAKLAQDGSNVYTFSAFSAKKLLFCSRVESVAQWGKVLYKIWKVVGSNHTGSWGVKLNLLLPRQLPKVGCGVAKQQIKEKEKTFQNFHF